MNLNQITLPAFDIEASVTFYRRLGFVPVVLAAHYARFAAPAGPATLSVHRVGEDVAETTPAVGQAVVYLESPDLDATVTALMSRGVIFTRLPRDEPWRWREARLNDPAGNRLCLYHAGENRLHPPWKVDPTQLPPVD